MTALVSVIVAPQSSIEQLRGLVTSLDAQTLAYDAFDVILLTQDHAAEERLSDLGRRRRNIAVRRVGDPLRSLTQVAEQLQTPWLVTIAPQQGTARLPPRSLEVLVAAAEAHDASWVAGRRHVVGRDAQDACHTDDRVVSSLSAEANAASLVLRARRPSASRSGFVVGSYPCLSVQLPSADQDPAPAFPVQVLDTTVSWSGPSLRLDVSGVLPAVGPLEVRASVSQVASGLDFWLPGTVTVDAAGGFRLAAELTPAVAAAGEPLGRGSWQLWLTVVEQDARGHRRRLRGQQAGGAVLDGRLVGSAQRRGPLAIDLDATKLSPLPTLDAARTRVAESAAGNLLTIELPGLHVDGEAQLDGAVMQDGLALPARLLASAEQTRIECYVSGLPGTRPLSTRFGGSAPHPSGLSLEIDPVGSMRVVPAPPQSPPEAVVSREATTHRPATGQAPSRLARWRRQVPSFLEPPVRWLARHETARRIYRRLTAPKR